MSFSPGFLSAVLEAHTPAAATGLLVAVSGGADSACLLTAAADLGMAGRGLPLRAVHIDHGLQAAAAEFRAGCAALCLRLNVPLVVVPVAVDAPPGASIEAAARDARYAALEQEMRPGECLLTAHHREDQAETLLLQALRGAGLKGLSAMPLCVAFGRGWHLRPLLDVPRHELRAYGAAAGCTATDDPMNEDAHFDRVYLRRQVWPLIESRWPGAGAALSRSARHAADAQELLDSSAALDVARLRDGAALSVPGLRSLRWRERVNAVRFWLSDLQVEPPSSVRLTEALRQIFDADADHLPVVVWGGHALRRYRQRVFLTGAQPPRLQGVRDWPVQPGAVLNLGTGLGTLRWRRQAGGIAAHRLPGSLSVRARQGGETLKPAAHASTQSLQHLCQSLGVLPWLRDALPLIYAGNALIAVADLWVDAHCLTADGAAGLGIVWDQAPVIV